MRTRNGREKQREGMRRIGGGREEAGGGEMEESGRGEINRAVSDQREGCKEGGV